MHSEPRVGLVNRSEATVTNRFFATVNRLTAHPTHTYNLWNILFILQCRTQYYKVLPHKQYITDTLRNLGKLETVQLQKICYLAMGNGFVIIIFLQNYENFQKILLIFNRPANWLTKSVTANRYQQRLTGQPVNRIQPWF